MSNYTGLRGQPNPLQQRISELEAENDDLSRYQHLYEVERRVRVAMDKSAEQTEATIERLTWMLDEAIEKWSYFLCLEPTGLQRSVWTVDDIRKHLSYRWAEREER